MRLRIVSHYLGFIAAILGTFMVIPLGWSLARGEAATLAFAISAAVTAGGGLLAWKLTPVRDARLGRREAVLIVVLGWLLASAVSSLPYVLAGTFSSYEDALFEAVSGFTTTGATVLTSIEGQMESVLVWRSLTQWLGGMGIITLFVALFPVFGIGAAHLVEAEMPGPQPERLTPRMRDTAKAVWVLYAVFSLLELALLLGGGMSPFHALTVTFSTMPTGGFTGTEMSIAAFNSVYFEGVITFFMLVAGVNFGLFYFIFWKRQARPLLTSPEFKVYLGTLLAAAVLVTVDLSSNTGLSIGQAIRQSSFQVVSTMTTTGFTTADFGSWPTFTRAVLLALMIIGASAGSTGGALKVVRVVVLAKYTYNQLRRAFNPRAVLPLKLGGTVLPDQVVSRVIGMTVLYFVAIFAGFVLMSAFGLDQETALSSVLATLGNVGPGLNLVGPAANYAFIPAAGKAVLMVCMLVGRLELFTVLVLIVPSFWRWR